MLIKGHWIKGSVLDDETRCTHYHTQRDIVAIKFFCCQTYYPCFSCHEEEGCGSPAAWPKEQFEQKAILCGSCGHELSINRYLQSASRCPYCKAPFNPGCRLHWHLYFER